MENVVVIGAGIAGLTAALYAGRAGLKPLVITGKQEGGQLMLTTMVENYPGFPDGVQGPELISKCKEQAGRFGARFKDGDVKAFSKKNGSYEIDLGGEKVLTRAAIIATGASARMLGLESEKKYFSRGVHTCATCDAYFYRDKDVVVIGGGDSACEEALFMTKLVKSIKIVHRRDKLRASRIMQERVLANRKIRIIWDSVVEEIVGDGKKVTGVKLRNLRDNKMQELETAAVFLAVGHIPNTDAFRQSGLELDGTGYLVADGRARTKLPGVFAAGDVHDRLYRQAVTAAGMGCQAALEAERYLSAGN